MSICSDVYITKAKAKEIVREKLLSQQESLIDAVVASDKNSNSKEDLLDRQTILVDQAISGMKSWDLTRILNDGSDDMTFYNITDRDA